MPQKRTFRRKDPTVADLKKQLSELQGKLAQIESIEPEVDEDIKELFNWTSPERVFVPRNKKWFINTALLVLILVVVTLILKEFLLMGAILAVLFVLYILATVPPQQIEHRITTQGIISNNRSYLWDELADFWFKDKYDYTLLEVDTYLRFPDQLSLIIADQDKTRIRDILVKYLPYREVINKSWLEKSGEWVTKKLSSV